MPTFIYRAKKTSGDLTTGSLVAETEKSALDVLNHMGLYPVDLRLEQEEISRNGAATGLPRLVKRGGSPGRIKSQDITIFSRQLADLLKAGVPLNRALATLADETSKEALAQVIARIKDDISSGQSLSNAFVKYPHIFSELYINMVRAGEAGGFLEDVLHRIALFSEKQEELKSRVKSAMAYPVLLMVVGTAAVFYLLTFFIPRFSTIFRDLGGALPLPTRIIMGISGFLQNYWLIIIATTLIALLLIWRMAKTESGKITLDKLKLQLPVIKDITTKTAISRFTRTLGTLLKSGVSILTALDIARYAAGNAVLAQAINQAKDWVREGRSLAEPLKESPYFPRIVTDMIAVGTESGNLDEVLINIADSYDSQVDRALKTFISLLEPVMILIMAIIVGFIVIAMLLPVFTLSSVFH